ncbi:polysaccharide deacetylase family protein [Flavobacterium sp. KACC 22758]|jgi:peptidoglycan/xylan/chitin deacetylase (PgdA/CDA1 family)|uniref:polysaccharide deacetylase family protein n=1 Tax=Flavobacterium sp. KACC 22758 TaxID=3025667 RepID=UPI002366F787|nr:polysaccharide deacetylase family protein [Flavobacterium sp. KACC 22758]WDF59085.1 polysaccharide deacetylase family protein [Flavobacterium sp. KACC 22758]
MLTVINYHYVRENFNSKYPSIFGVTPYEFKKQLLLLTNKGEFINPPDLVNNIDKVLPSKNNYFFVTFDDGLKEQFDLSLPILDELEIPAVFFVNTLNFENKKVSIVHKIHLLRSIIDPELFLVKINENVKIDFSDVDKNKSHVIYRYDTNLNAELKYILNFKLSFKQQELIVNKMFDNYFDETQVLQDLYMSDQNLQVLGQKKYLGSHTHSHYPLGLTDSETIRFELEHSKKYLEKLTDSKIKMVSYPYGTDEVCTDEVSIIAQNTGYDLGFTTKRGSNIGNENHLLLNRFDCNDLPGGKNS